MGLGQHGVVLKLRLSQGWGVGSNDNKLGLSRSEGLDGGLESQGVFTRLDSQGKLGVNVFCVLSWGLLVSLNIFSEHEY